MSGPLPEHLLRLRRQACSELLVHLSLLDELGVLGLEGSGALFGYSGGFVRGGGGLFGCGGLLEGSLRHG